jgi:DNA-binding transcriptional MerR regulator
LRRGQGQLFDVKRSTPDSPQVPDKVYFRIGEVSHLVGVDTHVLRYWESEFSLIKPFRGKSRQRLYRRQDVENLLRIKGLLHDEGYTISGARKYLKNLDRNSPTEAKKNLSIICSPNEESIIAQVKHELHKILAQLSSPEKDHS